MKTVHVVDAVRTPIGRCNGALSSVRPDDLAAHVLRELLAGTVAHQLARRGSGTGEENRDVARMAALCIGVGQGLALVLDR